MIQNRNEAIFATIALTFLATLLLYSLRSCTEIEQACIKQCGDNPCCILACQDSSRDAASCEANR